MKIVKNITAWPGRGAAARELCCSESLVSYYMRIGRLGFVQTQIGRAIDPSSLARLRRELEERRAQRAGTVIEV